MAPSGAVQDELVEEEHLRVWVLVFAWGWGRKERALRNLWSATKAPENEGAGVRGMYDVGQRGHRCVRCDGCTYVCAY